MSQQISVSLIRGGLDIVTPPIAIEPGKAINALNYEPDISGATRIGGYERFDGQVSPSGGSSPAEIAARRTAIQAVPGMGPVRGVWVYDGALYAFRDALDGVTAGMYKSTVGGWALQVAGYTLAFSAGTAEFVEGSVVVGGTSAAQGVIARMVLLSGNWSGTATGFLVLSSVTGTFSAGEALASSPSGAATNTGAQEVTTLKAGGKYDFTTKNFYGAGSFPKMYFVNGVNVGMEWGSGALAPLRTGAASTALSDIDFVLTAGGDYVLADNGDFIILSADFDAPSFITHFQNHLFIGYNSGALLFSSIGEPLTFITTLGAGEISFGDPLTGLLSAAATSMMVFGVNRMEYLTGTDQDTFVLNPISDSSGAQPYTAQMMDAPTFLDDGGVRQTPTTAAFGDWRMGTLTGLIEPMILAKRDSEVVPVCSMRIKAKDQYKLFWSDGTGITLYLGRKYPETFPFKYPFQAFCACSGEMFTGLGDRCFVGAEDGYVYEINRGTSFDGANIEAYIELAFTAEKSPMQDTRWMKATYEINTPDPIEVGVSYRVDYGNGIGSDQVDVDVPAGEQNVVIDYFANLDWQAVQGRLEYHTPGYGPNIAVTLYTSANDKRAHTISSQALNYSRRRLRG